MGQQRSSHRRREDGIVEIVGTGTQARESLRGFEIALAVVALAVGAASAVAGNLILAGLLAGGVTALFLVELVRDRRGARHVGVRTGQPAPASNERVSLRVIRLDDQRTPPVAVRPPGTEASPRG